jgi:hypothetical protein
MYSKSKTAGRFSFLLSPAGIVIGYILTLIAIVAGTAMFPSSNAGLALLFVVVGAFFVVSVPVLVTVYLFFMCALVAGLRSLARRLIFGADRSQMTNKSSLQHKHLEFQGANAGLWDRWID